MDFQVFATELMKAGVMKDEIKLMESEGHWAIVDGVGGE
jgi:hypothetical protein